MVAGRRGRGAVLVAAVFALLFAVLALPPATFAAQPTPAARPAAACSVQRNGSATRGEAFYAFVLRGPISCSKAHSLIHAYFGKTGSGRGCAGRGTACGYEVARVWWCSLPGYAGARFDAGCCYQGTGPHASCSRTSPSVSVYQTTPPATARPPLHIRLFELPDASVACELDAFFGPTYARCSVSSSSGGAVPAAWIEGSKRMLCSTADENGETPEGGFPCPALRLPHKVLLAYGRETELGGIRCVSATQGMTCTGAGGRGFRINSHEVVAIG